jgi:hypothetical protein
VFKVESRRDGPLFALEAWRVFDFTDFRPEIPEDIRPCVEVTVNSNDNVKIEELTVVQ